jgi:hypothetical protein
MQTPALSEGIGSWASSEIQFLWYLESWLSGSVVALQADCGEHSLYVSVMTIKDQARVAVLGPRAVFSSGGAFDQAIAVPMESTKH